jgi:hypothetical protein
MKKKKITDRHRQMEGIKAGFLNCKIAHKLHVPCEKCEMCKGHGPAHGLTHQDKDLFCTINGRTKAEYRRWVKAGYPVEPAPTRLEALYEKEHPIVEEMKI